MAGKPTANFHHTFEANIWKTVPVLGRDWLLIELRHPDQHQASFALLDVISGQFVWNGLQFDESWWVGLTAADGNHALFHIYEDDQNPDSKAYFVLELSTQEVGWQISECVVEAMQDGTVLAYRSQDSKKVYFEVSVNSGEIEEISTQRFQAFWSTIEGQNKNAKHPFHYVQGHAYFDTVARYLDQIGEPSPTKALDYLEYTLPNGSHQGQVRVVISYYIKEDEKLSNTLLVLNQKGEKIFHEMIDRELLSVGMGTFLIFSGKLVVIKDKKDLVIYNL